MIFMDIKIPIIMLDSHYAQCPKSNRKLCFLEISIRDILIFKKQIFSLDIDCHTLNIELNVYQLKIETKSLKI